ncbi:MAG: hypothetical protein JWP52_1468 [Rhizobacter sp.]|jgi:TRAP-type C4-dicarboxylate transport system permease small subunit|nr:hypothetical protein [Rhizobacter sp.]
MDGGLLAFVHEAGPAGGHGTEAVPSQRTGDGVQRFFDGLFWFAGMLAAACVFAIFVLMIGASIGRSANWGVGWINDIVAWLSAAAAFLAMPYAFRQGDFVRVTLLLEKLAPAPRRTLEAMALTVAAIACSYLAWWAIASCYESWAFQDVATGMVAIPTWWPQLAFVAGAVLLALAVVNELVLVLRGQKPTYVRLVEERHARGDFSSDV